MIMGGLLFIALNIVNLLDLSLMVSLLLKIFVSVIVFLLSGHILGQWKLLAKIIKGEK
jgi:hypothetical protein